MSAITYYVGIGMVIEKERDNLKHKRTRKELQIDTEHQYEQMESKTPSERAKKWFDRKPYSIRGDTSGQVNLNRVQEYERRN